MPLSSRVQDRIGKETDLAKTAVKRLEQQVRELQHSVEELKDKPNSILPFTTRSLELQRLTAEFNRAVEAETAAIRKANTAYEAAAVADIRQRLRDAAERDSKQRDLMATKLRTRANLVGAAVITASIGLLTTKIVSAKAEGFFVSAVALSATSAFVFVCDWSFSLISHQWVGAQRRRSANRIAASTDQVPPHGRFRDAVLPHLPWIFAIGQTALVAFGAATFIKAVLQVAHDARAAAGAG